MSKKTTSPEPTEQTEIHDESQLPVILIQAYQGFGKNQIIYVLGWKAKQLFEEKIARPLNPEDDKEAWAEHVKKEREVLSQIVKQ
jgi:hypothetical protein